VKEHLARPDIRDAYILDGFPRTLAQAEALDGFSRVDRVINFDIPDDKVIERLSGRLVCRSCGFNWHRTLNPPARDGICGKCGGEIYTREDDTDRAIAARLDVYRERTLALIEYYRARKLLLDIDAGKRPDEVFAAFKTAIGNFQVGQMRN
jgi:adenylate kinase